jgi:hypothetical protein
MSFSTNAPLREQVLQLAGEPAAHSRQVELDAERGIVTAPDAPRARRSPVDVVVTVAEINDQHGTGPLVKRVFRGRKGIFSVRSRDDWGVHDFGDWSAKLSSPNLARAAIFREVVDLLQGRRIASVTCVPFLTQELLLAIAIKEAFGAKLCLWIMDDQNIAINTIPDSIMRECLTKCSLRLFTHHELRFAYEQKYGLPGYILPAVVPEKLAAGSQVGASSAPARSGALLGSFWDQSWFDRLCSALEYCNFRIDWFGQNRSPWVKFPPEDLARAHITPHGIVPEERLALELRKYLFVICPVGSLDARETNRGVASLSLPGRILFAAATSHTPILIVGSPDTCGARFVKRYGLGTVVPYEAEAVAAAVDHLTQPHVQRTVRANAAAIAPMLSDRGIEAWLATSIHLGLPADDRFERIFSGYTSDIDLPFANKAASEA